jgi:hypothetical protein
VTNPGSEPEDIEAFLLLVASSQHRKVWVAGMLQSAFHAAGGRRHGTIPSYFASMKVS